jgi:prenylcysteine oxidase/farnesylcysteine lyase
VQPRLTSALNHHSPSLGAGAGGASTAYHLSKYTTEAGIPTNITVFERSSYVGGRTTTVDAWSDPYTPIELGGSIFVEVNHILVNASRDFHLSTSSFDRPTPANTPELGIWNGLEFIVTTHSEDGWWEKAKLLWRYGLAPIKTNSLMKSTVSKFLQMYEEPLFPWPSLNDAVEQIGLKETVAVTGEQFLQKNGIGAKFGWEIIQAATRVNYAANIGLIHGLETMVCMATSGAMAIQGGNWQIFANMLKSSATTHLNTTITAISKQPDATYELTTSDGQVSVFDTVVLAAPFQFSKLVIDPPPQNTPEQIPYVNLHVTLFASPHELDPAAFGLAPGEKVPQFVLTTLAPDENPGSDPKGVGKPGFFSVSIVGDGLNPLSTPKNRPEYIYKIFSPDLVDSEFLSKLLGRHVSFDSAAAEGDADIDPNGPVSWIHRKLWQSYPYEYPRVTFEEIKLDEGLWYTSGIESFISTMETSALMGKNVAKLVVDEWIEHDAEAKETLLKVQGDGAWEFDGFKKDEDKEQVELKAKR